MYNRISPLLCSWAIFVFLCRDKKTNIVHYLAELVQKKYPDLANFHTEVRISWMIIHSLKSRHCALLIISGTKNHTNFISWQAGEIWLFVIVHPLKSWHCANYDWFQWPKKITAMAMFHFITSKWRRFLSQMYHQILIIRQKRYQVSLYVLFFKLILLQYNINLSKKIVSSPNEWPFQVSV